MNDQRTTPGLVTKPEAPPQDPGLAGRVLVFVALLAVTDLWAYHHFGAGIRNIGLPVGIAAAIGAAVKVSGFLFGDKRVRDWLRAVQEPIKKVVRPLVTASTLTAFCLVLVTAMLTFSSITVVTGDAGEGATIEVAAIDPPAVVGTRVIGGGTTTGRFAVMTTPFGRLFRVDAAGYVGGTFTVYPPVGLRLRLGADLAMLPTLLFRPAPETLGHLADGAVFRVFRLTESGVDTIAADSGHAGSFLLGRPRAITPALVDEWARTLTALGATEAAAADVLSLWNTPRSLAPGAPLRTGDVLRAEVMMGAAVVGRAEISIGGGTLVDVRLVSVRPGSED